FATTVATRTRGTATKAPTGPQIHSQKPRARNTMNGLRVRFLPTTVGVTIWPSMILMPRNTIAGVSDASRPSNVALPTPIRITKTTAGPRQGLKLASAASGPQGAGDGTARTYSAKATTTPRLRLTTEIAATYRDSKYSVSRMMRAALCRTSRLRQKD